MSLVLVLLAAVAGLVAGWFAGIRWREPAGGGEAHGRPTRTGRDPARPVRVEVPAGELIDKITILGIKSDRLSDPDKLRNVRTELATLEAARDAALPESAALTALTAELRGVNETLWGVEDEIRLCERDGDFGERFVALARSVYRHNDRRAALKRRINELLGSRLVEEKGYAQYGDAAAPPPHPSGGGLGDPPP